MANPIISINDKEVIWTGPIVFHRGEKVSIKPFVDSPDFVLQIYIQPVTKVEYSNTTVRGETPKEMELYFTTLFTAYGFGATGAPTIFAGDENNNYYVDCAASFAGTIDNYVCIAYITITKGAK
ncbi:hypothetical protein [Methylobacterium aquaticum]|uniref:Uncharacterized protein n=1 Tax=Methylobacterium aquaticum TaxID=270351 RepID=A0A0C6F7V3_9HYPH|nr:hypothetical protein [Methylobacterium aquaticum]BAQ44423.1 hypothetical protein Maq22A_c05175 [Methylobacterium aquaticum]